MAFSASALTVDGVAYHVRIVYDSLMETFELLEGVNAGEMLSGRHERDLLGTGYAHQMQLERDPAHPADLDALYDVLSAPVDSHTVVMPHGQGAITYQAMIESGQRLYGGRMGGQAIWKNMTVNYRYIAPQLRPV